jgi:SAM-dependent methyltransferase
MRSPWLDVPLADYEGHMAHVGQAQFLDRHFGKALEDLRPGSVAVLGAAGGNGFDRLPGSTARRTVAIDINPRYLAELERRHAGSVAGLGCLCGDLADPAIGFEPVDYVHAALVFEYTDPAVALGRMGEWLKPAGVLGVVLQLEGGGCISPSPFPSLGRLIPSITLREPGTFANLAREAGLERVSERVVSLPGGKRLHAARYRLKSPAQTG